MTKIVIALLALTLAACGAADDPPPPAQCWCTKPIATNAVSQWQCACGSEEHRRWGR
jgi:predicted outer membrane protein